MALETTLQPRQKWWNILYAFICGGLALWGAYDYWVSIPEREQQFATYESNKKRHEELAAKATQGAITDAERSEYGTLDTYFQQRAEKNLPVPTNPPAYDRPVQMWLYIVGCGVMGVPWFLWQWLSVAGKRYRLDDDGTLHAPGMAPIPAGQIAEIDMTKWMTKSIATVKTADGRALLLDDYKFRGVDLIVGAIASRFYPDDWTPDGRDLKRLRLQEAEAEQPASGGDGGSTAGTA